MTPLALTMGEPAGVCAEISVAAWSALRAAPQAAFFLIADAPWARRAADARGVACVEIGGPAEAAAVFPRALPVLPIALAEPARAGVLNPRNAPAVVRSIDVAVDLAMAGQAAGVVTNPVHKQTLYDGAAFAYPGHTEYLAARAGVARTVMLMASEQLKVAPATIHIPLSEVPRAVTPALLDSVIRIVEHGLRSDFGVAAPRIAVSGLNPHAGEGGAIGREETEVLGPCLRRLAADGLDVIGPLSADTMFHEAARARYDAAVCMYHDQALIPIKTLAFDKGVNVTLGLPFVRTSPDHGPALDIAGEGDDRARQADPQSLIEALRLAATIAARRTAA